MASTNTSWQFYLGIDPSAQSSGLALIVTLNGAIRRRECCTVSPYKELRGAARLDYIYSAANHFLHRTHPYPLSRTCIEGAALHSTNRETVLSEVRGIFLLSAYQHGGREPLKIAPSQLKKFETGNGSASKEDVLRSLLARGNWEPENDDEADACVAAEIAYSLDHHETTTLTRPQLELTLQLLQGKAPRPVLVGQKQSQPNI